MNEYAVRAPLAAPGRLALDYRRLFESAPDRYLVLGPDLAILDASDGYLNATQTERAAIVGRPLFDVFPDNPDDAAATGVDNLHTSLARVLRTRTADAMAIQKYDIRVEGGGFEERYWSPLNTPVLGAGGEIDYIIHRVEDVTEFVLLKQQSQRLREAERPTLSISDRIEFEVLQRAQDVQDANRKLEAGHRELSDALHKTRRVWEDKQRALIENAHDGIMILDSKGVIVEANRQMEILLSRPREDFIGATLDSFRAAGQPITRSILDILLSAPVIRIPNMASASGKPVHADVSASKVRFDDSDFVLVIARDVTRQVELEQQLRQSQRLEAIGHLSGGVAHDFNNLLTVITTTVDVLSARVADQPKLAALAATIDQAAERGAQLTQRMLAFARKQPLNPRAINLNDAVTRAVDVLQRTVGENIHVSTALAASPWLALADLGQVEDAILNLAVNARDAMPDGGRLLIETANVHLDADYAEMNPGVAPGDYAALIVTDSGIGMSADLIDRAFEPFFTTKDVGRGTGLGLSMIYGFVKQSNGHIKIYSEVGHGTSVKLYLPRTSQTLAGQTAPEVSRGAAGGKETILVVEDDAAVRAAAVAILETLGYHILQAPDGPSALALLKSPAQIDLLFTDLIMPNGMAGEDLMRAARAERPALKILFTTGYSETFIEQRGKADKSIPLLGKPYRRQQLADAVRNALDA